MTEQEEQQIPQDDQESPQEEVVLPPLITHAEQPPAETAGSPEASAEQGPVPEAELPDQAAEEAEVFQRPRRLKDLQPGMVLEGKVTSVAIYGVFVDIGVGREGLVHLSQITDQPISTPTEVVQIGDMVTVRVLDVDTRSKRISLTMREQVEPEVDEEKLGALTPGTVVEGTVTSLTRFGAFVDVGVGRDGLVPLSQLDTKGAQRISDVLQVGEEVRVRVLDVDRKNNRIRLSMRNVYDPEQFASLQPGSIVRGRVTSLAPFGAFIDLGVGKDGLVHISEMGEPDIRHPREALQAGEEIEVRVVDVDPETQRISLSLQLQEEAPWVPETLEEEAEEEEFVGEATLEDLAARFSAMRPRPREEPERRVDHGEKEKRAVREALRQTLEKSRQEEQDRA